MCATQADLTDRGIRPVHKCVTPSFHLGTGRWPGTTLARSTRTEKDKVIAKFIAGGNDGRYCTQKILAAVRVPREGIWKPTVASKYPGRQVDDDLQKCIIELRRWLEYSCTKA